MTKIRLFSSFIWIAIFISGCARAPSPASTGSPAVEISPTFSSPVPTLNTSAQSTAKPGETLIPSPLPVATSRGPELHASDPMTVDLASGGLQLVEFFRFT